ncbi:MAG TPA: SRPBCC domain-containing protein, partial [Candidatus Angelobacter sp.]|nr:SRPBCC domain-containing protein [Candidatus Angelobacter sp.]
MTKSTVNETERMVVTRVFDAPRELVWKAWTDPKYVMQWWGPKGFT